jgi:hypothetical protein
LSLYCSELRWHHGDGLSWGDWSSETHCPSNLVNVIINLVNVILVNVIMVNVIMVNVIMINVIIWLM